MKELELTDEMYDSLVDEHGKLVVVQVDEDKYVVRYPNKIEFDIIKKSQLKGDVTRGLATVESTVQALIVWPEHQIVADRLEQDGGLINLISSQFISFYMNRAVMDEKKR